MTEALRRSAKAHHAISVSCWPAAVYRLHDLDGKPTSDPDTTMMDNMAASVGNMAVSPWATNPW